MNNVHLRFDSNDSHTRVTLFMRGASCGQLTLRPEEAIWLHNIIFKGCDALRLNFLSSGKPPVAADSDIDQCAQVLSR